MKGGVTVIDMAERKAAMEFLEWMRKVNPEALSLWLAAYEGEHRSGTLSRLRIVQ